MRRLFLAILFLAVILLPAGCGKSPETVPDGSSRTETEARTAAEPQSSAGESSAAETAADAGQTAEPSHTAAVTEAAVLNETGWISGVSVNFRRTAGTDGEIISRLAKGTQIVKLREEGEWLFVSCDGVMGYIHRDYVQSEPPEADTDEVRIVVKKGERRLELWQGGTLTGTYPVGLGFDPVGHKQAEGDGKTPEGEYYVCMKNSKSKYYLSLGVSYPNKADAAAALADGRISQAAYDRIAAANDWGERPDWYSPLGGEIMIHGGGGDRDWTAGCMAVDDEVVDILFRTCPVGTRITILP